jgi:hypothetical protein
MTAQLSPIHRGVMLVKIARAVCAAVTLPFHALAAARAAMAFGHDYDHSLTDDELLDELCRPTESPLIRRKIAGSQTARREGKPPRH